MFFQNLNFIKKFSLKSYSWYALYSSKSIKIQSSYTIYSNTSKANILRILSLIYTIITTESMEILNSSIV